MATGKVKSLRYTDGLTIIPNLDMRRILSLNTFH
jgi:hypothetical protein